MPTRVSVAGASGRMGQTCVQLIDQADDFQLAGAWGRDGTPVYDADVLVDFSLPHAILETAEHIQGPWVIGVTGLAAEHQAAIDTSAKRVPVVVSGNFSLGVNVMLGLVRQAAKSLPEFQKKILDTHHINKVDAPSGTAKMLANSMDYAGDIISKRDGDVIGEHTVTFAGTDEVLEIKHTATDRTLFARGALHAARWTIGKPPGIYTMQDVLDLNPS